jgi:DNA-binding MarR family transcriptional regulator
MISVILARSGGPPPVSARANLGEIGVSFLPVRQALTAIPEGLRSTELASYARITKQSIDFLVDHLVTGGYLERLPDPRDRRAKVIRLTPRGWTAAQTACDAVRRVEQDWERRIGSERIAQLREILRDLVSSFSKE